jgi:hypothetical protein
MTNQQLGAVLLSVAVMAIAIAVHTAWRIKHDRFTVDEMDQNNDQRSQKHRR